MVYNGSHLSDQDLLLAADGELSSRRQSQVQRHLQSCWTCRKRMSEVESTISDVVESYHSLLDETLPPGNGSEAVLRARLRPAAASGVPPRRWLAFAACAVVIASVTGILSTGRSALFMAKPVIPNPVLTPGEAAPVSKSEICQADLSSDNQEVPEALREAVFTEYGLNNAPRSAYEVDFLITPALGGAASIRNLWPEPYNSRTWNAHTKDVLERRLHTLVCSGQVDLFTAQREIAANWVDAYKKYVPQ